MPRWPSPVGEALRHVPIGRWLPNRHGDDPLTGRRGLHQVGNARKHVVNRFGAGERWIDVLETFTIHVRMAVDKARNHRLAGEVDDLRAWLTGRANELFAAHGQDTVAADRK